MSRLTQQILLVFLASIAVRQSLASSPASCIELAYLHPTVIKDTIPEVDSADLKVFEIVEEEAYFPGKENGWRNFLIENLNPSVPVDKGAPAGIYTVYIQFIVGKDGKVFDIKPLTKHGFGMEAEVVRILKKSPPWIPAVQLGRNVNAYRKQPVTFQVIEEKKKKRGRN